MIASTIGLLYFPRLKEKEERIKFLSILSNVMCLSFFFILAISLFKIIQKDYDFNMEIIFMATIIAYIITIILYKVPNRDTLIKWFMILFSIFLFISSILVTFGFLLPKKLWNFNSDNNWILGIFLMSCSHLIKLDDFNNNKK